MSNAVLGSFGTCKSTQIFAVSTRLNFLCAFVLLACSLSAGTAAGQSTAARLSGTVYDEQHAVLPGASVTLRNVETGRMRTTVANKMGNSSWSDSNQAGMRSRSSSSSFGTPTGPMEPRQVQLGVRVKF
jgi:hypothetical protein